MLEPKTGIDIEVAAATPRSEDHAANSKRYEMPLAIRYSLPVVSVGVTTALTNEFIERLQPVDNGLFFGAIILSSLCGGLGPGIFATVLSLF